MPDNIIELHPGSTVSVFAKDESIKWDSRDDSKRREVVPSPPLDLIQMKEE